MLKSLIPSIVALLLAGAFAPCVAVGEPSSSLPRSAPEAQGVSSAAVLSFIEAADRGIDQMNSFMLLRHGRVVAEGWWAPYGAEHNHVLYSLSKSFTSTAVGLAAAEGKLTIDDEVLKFFPDDAPAEPSPNLKAMRVRDLLTMSAGHQDETSSAPEEISAKAFLAHPVPHKPGTHFKYNTPATFMLSAIVGKQTGQTLLDYLRPRLFEPLGIEHPVWDANWQGISLGGYGLRVRTEDIARFGQLYLQKGNWKGKQLIPAEWVEMATARQVSNGSDPKSDWDQGYGFQFWRSRHGAYRGDGAFGQYCLVLPEQDAVVAITAGVKDMQAVLNLIWEHLLPGFHWVSLPADPESQKRLEEKLAGLAVPAPEGAAAPSAGAGIFGRKFVFPKNDQKLEAIALSPAGAGGGVTLVSTMNGVESRYAFGYREWKKGRGPFTLFPDEPLAGSMAWAADGTCVLKLCAYETPFYLTLKLGFSGNQVKLDSEANVAFGPTKRPQLVGQAE